VLYKPYRETDSYTRNKQMKTLASWNRMNDRNKQARLKANERRRDNKVRKEAGLQNYDPTATIPQWFINLYTTFDLKAVTPKGAWREWSIKTLDNTGIDPRKVKKRIGRPKLPDHLKKTPLVRTGRADKMEQLLLSNGIHLTRVSKYGVVYLSEHPTVMFLPNGRLELEDGSRISVFKFLSNLAT